MISRSHCSQFQGKGSPYTSEPHLLPKNKNRKIALTTKASMKQVTETKPNPSAGSFWEKFQAKMLYNQIEVMDNYLGERKENLMSKLHDGTVLEIGIGTAPNFKYYGRNVDKIVGVDPNPAVEAYAESQAARLLGQDKDKFQLIQGKAEDLPFDDNSIDAVVGTHIMCTVKDLDKALSEILRVLKPGGFYIFVDHVAAKPGGPLFAVQKTLEPGWKCVASGCHLTRDVLSNIRRAGFSAVNAEEFEMSVPWAARIFAPHIAGVATK